MKRHESKKHLACTRERCPIKEHVLGAVAEVVFGNWQGFPIDENVYEHGDDCDFRSRRNETVDVKASTFRGYDIHLKEEVYTIHVRRKAKDIYVLCRSILSGKIVTRIEVIGWAFKYVFLDKKNIQQKPYNKDCPLDYTIGPSMLQPFEGMRFGAEVWSKSPV